jgi:hypothetical protein
LEYQRGKIADFKGAVRGDFGKKRQSKMNKTQAIQIAREYLNKKNTTPTVSIDARDLLDEEPVEFKDYWCFKSYYESLNPMRGGGPQLNSVYPFYLISKETKEITLANWSTYDELKKE